MQTYTRSANKSTTTINKDQKSFSQTIQRCPHDKKNPYVMIHNGLIRDQTVSPQCRHFLCYLLCNSDDWIINVENLQNEFSEWYGRDKIYKLINEAIEHGYMRKEVKYERGCIHTVRYFVIEMPSRKSFKKSCTRTDFQDPRTRTYNKEQGKNKKDNTEKIETKAHTPPSSSIIVFKDEKREVRIDTEIYDKLEADIGKIELIETIDSMKNYLIEDQKRNFNNAKIEDTIRKWNKRFQRTKKDEKRRKELEEISKKEENKAACLKIKQENMSFLNKLLEIRSMKDQIKMCDGYVLVLKTQMTYNFLNPGLRMSLEKALNVKLE